MRYGKGYKRYDRTGCQVVISLELLGQETKYSTHLYIKLSDGAEFEEDEENITNPTYPPNPQPTQQSYPPNHPGKYIAISIVTIYNLKIEVGWRGGGVTLDWFGVPRGG